MPSAVMPHLSLPRPAAMLCRRPSCRTPCALSISHSHTHSLSLTHSLTHTLTYSLTYSLTHTLIHHPLTHSYLTVSLTRSLTHSLYLSLTRMDGGRACVCGWGPCMCVWMGVEHVCVDGGRACVCGWGPLWRYNGQLWRYQWRARAEHVHVRSHTPLDISSIRCAYSSLIPP